MYAWFLYDNNYTFIVIALKGVIGSHIHLLIRKYGGGGGSIGGGGSGGGGSGDGGGCGVCREDCQWDRHGGLLRWTEEGGGQWVWGAWPRHHTRPLLQGNTRHGRLTRVSPAEYIYNTTGEGIMKLKIRGLLDRLGHAVWVLNWILKKKKSWK